MKGRIKINKVIKTSVFTWLVLSFAFLFISTTPTQASNDTITREDAGTSLTENIVLEISGNNLVIALNELENRIKIKDSADKNKDPVSDSEPKTGNKAATETSQSDSTDLKGKAEETDSTDLKGKAEETDSAESPETQAVDQEKTKISEKDSNNQKTALKNSEGDSKAISTTKTLKELKSNPEQSRSNKLGTDTQEDPESDPKQIADSGTSKATKSLSNEDPKAVLTSSGKTKIQTYEKTKTESKATEVTGMKDKDLSCKTTNLLPTSSTEKLQKTGSTSGSCNTNSGSLSYGYNSGSPSCGNNSSSLSCGNNSSFLSCGNNSGSLSCGNNSSFNSSGNNSGSNSSGNNSGSNSSGNNSGSNSSGNNSGSNSSITDPGFSSSSTDPGFSSSSTDSDDSGGESYGKARIIKPYSIQGNEVSGPVVSTADAIGLKELHPKIEENFAKTSLISGPSKSTSFLIGFLGTLLFLVTIVIRKK